MSPKLTLPGTGTPTPLLYRAGSSYLVSFGEEVLLFDCGPACVQRLLKKGVPPKCITGLFLTLFIRDYQKLVKNNYNILFYIAYQDIFIRRFREDEYLRPVSQ